MPADAQDDLAALAALEAALRAELGLETSNPNLRLPPRPARGWSAFLSLALVALATDRTRDTLALAWRSPPDAIDAQLSSFEKLGWIDGFGTRSAAPSATGYEAIARHLMARGRLAVPLAQ